MMVDADFGLRERRVADIGEAALRAKLLKIEALFRRAGSPGERAAAQAAMSRLESRLQEGGGPEVEMKFSLPDGWSVRLFVAVCRKHGLRPYRYPRQRRTT
ncbi:MAG: hypothetical protein RIM80_12750, partial [Alphaproteobacteria bacterium]